MKKFCFVLIAILLLSGCSKIPLENAYSSPPVQILFRGGYEKIAEFIMMMEKDDKELEEYLAQNDYESSEIQTREDMKAFLATLKETYFPVMENAVGTYINFYTNWDEALIGFELVDGSVYKFKISTKPDTAEERIQLARSEMKGKLSENINRSSDDIKIYPYTKTRSDNDSAENFFMDVRGVYVLARVFNESDFSKMSNTLQEVKFLRLDEILQNLPPPVEKPTDRADVDETEGYTDEFGAFYLE